MSRHKGLYYVYTSLKSNLNNYPISIFVFLHLLSSFSLFIPLILTYHSQNLFKKINVAQNDFDLITHDFYLFWIYDDKSANFI